MEQTECSETSAYKIQTPGNYPEECIKHSEITKVWNQEWLLFCNNRNNAEGKYALRWTSGTPSESNVIHSNRSVVLRCYKADEFVLHRISTGCSSVALHRSCRMKLRIFLSSVVMRETRFELIGLDSTWLDWIRLDWTGFDLVGLDSTWLDSILLDWTRFDLIGLDSTWLDSIRLDWTGFDLKGLDSTLLDTIRLDFTRLYFILLRSTWLHAIWLDCIH